jgi:hypothetical protein
MESRGKRNCHESINLLFLAANLLRLIMKQLTFRYRQGHDGLCMPPVMLDWCLRHGPSKTQSDQLVERFE